MSKAAKNRAKNQAPCTAAATAARSKAILVTNIETGVTVEYVSQREAARKLKVNEGSIRYYIKSGKAFHGIWLLSIKKNS